MSPTPTPQEAKAALLRLSLALPLFVIEGDTYNATTVASIGISEGDEQDDAEMYVVLIGTGLKDAIYYSGNNDEETYQMRDDAVAAWKAALKKLYE